MSRKLTSEEESKLDSFIGRAVRRNLQLGVLSNRVGANVQLDIQELYNSELRTLRQFGSKLEKLQSDSGGRFSEKEPYLVGGIVPTTEMMDILELIILEREYNQSEKNRLKKIEQLNRDLDNMKTPDEIRAAKQEELKKLLGETVEELQTPPSA